jgi:hypothetical protein
MLGDLTTSSGVRVAHRFILTGQTSGHPPGVDRSPRAASPRAHQDLRSTIRISRTHPRDCGQRQVFVRLDGGPRAALTYGQVTTVEVQPGRHLLFVHNTLFWKNVRFSIESGEHLEFVLINGARWWTAGMAGVLGAAPLFLTVRQVSLV